MSQNLYCAYHVGKWFKYDRFGLNSSRPLLVSPMMVWCTEISSGVRFWPFPTCPKMTNFPPNGNFQACRKRTKCITGTDFFGLDYCTVKKWQTISKFGTNVRKRREREVAHLGIFFQFFCMRAALKGIKYEYL